MGRPRNESGHRLPGGDDRRAISVELEGEAVPAREGDSLAAALLASGHDVFARSIKYHRARGPYCLSGRCSQCLLRVDGEANVAACTTPARDGARLSRQNAFPSASVDVLHAIDWLYPKGIDHHALFAGVPVVERAVQKVARHLAGLGTLPDAATLPAASYLLHETDVLVVGAGPAGLAAAAEAASAGVQVTLVEDHPAPGGRLRCGLELPDAPAPAFADERLEVLEAAGGKLLAAALAFGYFRDGGGPTVAVRAAARRLVLVRHRALVVATGGSEPLPPFAGNDLPGIYAGRGLARLVHETRVLPAGRIVVAEVPAAGLAGPLVRAEAVALAQRLVAEGAEVTVVGAVGAAAVAHRPGVVVAASGHVRLASVTVEAAGRQEKLNAEALALCVAPAPLVDLARQAGARVVWDAAASGFVVEAAADGTTAAAGILACGELAGACSALGAARSGAVAGRRAAALVREARR